MRSKQNFRERGGDEKRRERKREEGGGEKEILSLIDLLHL